MIDAVLGTLVLAVGMILIYTAAVVVGSAIHEAVQSEGKP